MKHGFSETEAMPAPAIEVDRLDGRDRSDRTSDRTSDVSGSERGMATAELLGNAALGIAALVAIWAVLQGVGLDVMEWIRAQLQV